MIQPILLVVGLAFSPAAVLARGIQDSRVDVGARLETLADLPVDELLGEAASLVASTPDEGHAALGASLDQAWTRAHEISDRAQLFVLAARMETEEFDRATVATRLGELLGAGDDAIGSAAAALLSDRGYRELKDADLEKLTKRLGQAATDDARSPEYRLEAAVALHTLGRGPEQREARKSMLDFLAS